NKSMQNELTGRIDNHRPESMSEHPGRNLTCDGLLFDMDGTVLTSIAAAERVWSWWARRHGLDVDAFLCTIHGKRAIDTVRDSGVAGIDVEVEATAVLDAEVADVDGIEPIAGAPEFLSSLP